MDFHLKPTVGRIVQYINGTVKHDVNGKPVLITEVLAALITQVDHETGRVWLAIFYPGGGMGAVLSQEGTEPGCWRWPPRD